MRGQTANRQQGRGDKRGGAEQGDRDAADIVLKRRHIDLGAADGLVDVAEAAIGRIVEQVVVRVRGRG